MNDSPARLRHLRAPGYDVAGVWYVSRAGRGDDDMHSVLEEAGLMGDVVDLGKLSRKKKVDNVFFSPEAAFSVWFGQMIENAHSLDFDERRSAPGYAFVYGIALALKHPEYAQALYEALPEGWPETAEETVRVGVISRPIEVQPSSTGGS